jgi:hypothetical protein
LQIIEVGGNLDTRVSLIVQFNERKQLVTDEKDKYRADNLRLLGGGAFYTPQYLMNSFKGYLQTKSNTVAQRMCHPRFAEKTAAIYALLETGKVYVDWSGEKRSGYTSYVPAGTKYVEFKKSRRNNETSPHSTSGKYCFVAASNIPFSPHWHAEVGSQAESRLGTPKNKLDQVMEIQEEDVEVEAAHQQQQQLPAPAPDSVVTPAKRPGAF